VTFAGNAQGLTRTCVGGSAWVFVSADATWPEGQILRRPWLSRRGPSALEAITRPPFRGSGADRVSAGTSRAIPSRRDSHARWSALLLSPIMFRRSSAPLASSTPARVSPYGFPRTVPRNRQTSRRSSQRFSMKKRSLSFLHNSQRFFMGTATTRINDKTSAW